MIPDVQPSDSVCVASSLAPAGSTTDDSTVDSSGPDFSAVSAEYVRQVYGLRGNGQTVAIIDSGIAYDHQALGGGFGADYRVVGGWDFTEEDDAIPYDDGPAGFHGTHVAGIIASDDPTHMGIAPDVDLVALRVFNDFGSGSVQWVEQALEWVYESRNDFRYPITTVNLSLGVSWNDLVLPDWASLENELAQLEQVGIFVAVAAGNSFAEFGSVGLNYPSVSPHVVPVSSVNTDGEISDFSQRGPSVLAGLGEQIVSSVPDHIYGVDGIKDDWAASTGTSMAAPFVTGSSVLVREAMQLAGQEAIDRSAIYSHLRSTADLVFDSTTNAWYHRINLPRAIDALFPADDFGSTPATAQHLGTLVDHQVVSGQLGKLSDRDHFTFVASASGEVTFQWDASSAVAVTNDDFTDSSVGDHGRMRWNVVAGQSYQLAVAAQEQLASYDVTLSFEARNPVQLNGNSLVVSGTEGSDVASVEIDEQLVIVFNGQRFTFSPDVVNRIEIHGNGGDDRLHIESGLPHGGIGRASTSTILRPGSADINAVQWNLAADEFEHITVVAPGGFDDVARLYDSSTNDEFISTPNDNVLTGNGFENRVIGFDRVYAYASSGQEDIARMFDSSGSDQFLARPESSILKGKGFHNKALGFDRVYAHASIGKDDVARFYDSANNDQLIATPESTILSGNAFYNKATGFNRTYAYSNSGTDDVARLFDSAGNDQFVATVNHSYLRGSGFFNKAIGFDRVYAQASDGNDDVARLHDSSGNDVFEGDTESSLLRGSGFYNQATGFDRAYGYSSGGQDVAQLTGSTNSDRFYSWTGRSVLRGSDYYMDVRGFKETLTDLTSGQDDVAYLYDSAGVDTYWGSGDRGLWHSGGFSTAIEGLDRVRAFSYRGGNDVAVLQTSLSSNFTEDGSIAVLTDPQSRHEVNNFEQVSLDGLVDEDYLASVDHLLELFS